MVNFGLNCRHFAANSGDNPDILRIFGRGSSHNGSLLVLGFNPTTGNANFTGGELNKVGVTGVQGNRRGFLRPIQLTITLRAARIITAALKKGEQM